MNNADCASNAEDVITIFVLIGSILCPIDVSPDSILTQMIGKLKRRKDPMISAYLEDYEDNRVDFYRLEPAPARNVFIRTGTGFAVTNADDAVKNLKKVMLDKVAFVSEVFGERSELRHVSLYIEKQSGVCWNDI